MEKKEPIPDLRKRTSGKVVPTDGAGAVKPAGPTKEDHQQMALKSHADCCKKSLQSVMLAVFIDAMGLAVLKPNFPLMVGQTPSSETFNAVSPIDPATAFYCLTGATQIGAFFSSLVIAPLSDKIGRRPCLNICMVGGAVCCVLKYLARHNFRLFVGASFINGLFGASMTVAMAYINDVFADPKDMKQKMASMGATQGLYMLGMTFGGILAMVLANMSIFFPLLPMAALNLIALANLRKNMVDVRQPESKKKKKKKKEEDGDGGGDDDSDAKPGEEKEKKETPLDNKVMWHVILGAFVDNLGSTGCSMALSPVLVTAFMAHPLKKLAAPLSATGYQAVAVCTSFSIIFGIKAAMPTFKKYGTAGGCVVGNIFTGLVLLILVQVAKPALDNPLGDDHAMYCGIYLAVYFIGFPLTVISQISTGPMLSAIAPPSKRGYVQGMNSAVMQIGMSLGSLGVAQLGASKGIETMMYTCVGLSAVAAMVNFPLTKHPKMGPPPKKAPPAAEEGAKGKPHWVSAESVHEMNMAALAKGETLPYVPYGSFEDDKADLDTLEVRAHSDFQFMEATYAKLLSQCQDPAQGAELVKGFNLARTSAENQAKAKAELGQWFSEYLTCVQRLARRRLPSALHSFSPPPSLLPPPAGALDIGSRTSRPSSSRWPLPPSRRSARSSTRGSWCPPTSSRWCCACCA
jgi:MFS family permease